MNLPWRYEIEDLWTSGELATFSNQFAIPVLVTRQGHAYRARVRMKDSSGRWSHWSAPVEFIAGAAVAVRLAEDLIVSEIMYDPPEFAGVEGLAFEFLELKNVGTATLDLSGLSFTAGINFTFPAGTLLPPGAFFLLARDAAGMALKYPGVVVNGIYTGRLDNAGETLTLTDANGATVFSFSYGSAAPWPDTPHGQGYSLVPVSQTVAFDMSNPMNWRASFSPGGIPGTGELVNPVPAILELNLHHAVVIHGQLGLHYRVDYQDAGESPDVWHVLADIPSLATTPYVVYDPSTAGAIDRTYRVLLMP